MEITRYDARRPLLRWAEHVRELVGQRNDTTAAENINQAAKQYGDDRFLLAVLGKAKRGKSTLLNALLGRHDDLIAPIDRLPASSTITRFGWGERESATVFFRDHRRESIAYAQVRQFVTEESNPGNAKGVELVEVTGPFAGLERDLILVDTPGAGSIHEHHDAILHGFIPQADAIIFLVTARMPLDQDEIDLLKRVKAADISKVFFAVNKVDEAEERDVQDAITHNRSLLSSVGIPVERIHRISAKRAFQGDVPLSGLPALLGEVRSFLETKKTRVLEDRLKGRVHYAAAPVLQTLEVEFASARKTSAELDSELRRLETARESLDSQRIPVEREFHATWDRAFDEFERDMMPLRADVIREIVERIDNAAIFSVGPLARELSTIITRSVEERLRPFTERLEAGLNGACARLQTNYPVVSMPIDTVVVRPRGSNDLFTGVAKGGAYTALGVALTHVVASTATAMAGVPILGAIAGSVTAVLAGPIALLPFGIGLYTAVAGWRLSRLKLKDQLYPASKEQITQLFENLRSDYLRPLRRQGDAIVEAYHSRLDRELADTRSAVRRARDRRPSPDEIRLLEGQAKTLRDVLAEYQVPATE